MLCCEQLNKGLSQGKLIIFLKGDHRGQNQERCVAVREVQASSRDTEAFSNNESRTAWSMLPYELINSPSRDSSEPCYSSVRVTLQGVPAWVGSLGSDSKGAFQP